MSVTHTYINTRSESHANDPYVALWSIKKCSPSSVPRVDGTSFSELGETGELGIIQRALFKLIHSC